MMAGRGAGQAQGLGRAQGPLPQWVVWLVAILWPAVALAHGGGTLRMSNAPVGPYLLSVWSQPDVLRVGEIHLTLAVTEPAAEGSQEAGPPVLDATVELTARPLDGGQAITVAASRDEAANKLFYEADFAVAQTGPWRFDVEVSGPLGGGGAGFDGDVLPASSLNLPLVAGAAVVLAVAVWLLQSRGRSKPPDGRGQTSRTRRDA